MRIIAGKYKGTLLQDPKGYRTHPMGERIRGALFNTLGDISGLCVLDACAGSGAIAVEALSRGAESVVAVEVDAAAYKVLEINTSKFSDIRTHRANVVSLLDQSTETFDVVVVDPPFNDVRLVVLDACVAATRLGGIIVLSLPIAYTYDAQKVQVLKSKQFGDAKLCFLKKCN